MKYTVHILNGRVLVTWLQVLHFAHRTSPNLHTDGTTHMSICSTYKKMDGLSRKENFGANHLRLLQQYGGCGCL